MLEKDMVKAYGSAHEKWLKPKRVK